MKKLIITLLIVLFLLIVAVGMVSAGWTVGGTGFEYRYIIESNSTISNMSIAVNDTDGVGGNAIWTGNYTNMYVYCSSSGCGSGNIAIGDEALTELNWENENDNSEGNNPASVWDTDYIAVYHLNDSGYSSTGANDSTIAGSPTFSTANGVFGNGMNFDNSNDYINLTGASLGNFHPQVTIEMWVYPTCSAIDYLWKVGGTAVGDSYGFIRTGGEYEFRLHDDPVTLKNTTAAGGFYCGIWNHLVVRKNATAWGIWINGTFSDSEDTADPVHLGNIDVLIGKSGADYFDGRVDEIRISATARSETYIQEQFWNGINNLTALGEEEGPPPGYPFPGTVYCNQFIFNTIIDITIGDAPGCGFFLNGANATGDCNSTVFNSTINANIGENNLTIYWTNTSGIFFDETLFNVSVCCNATYINDTICGGLDFSYLILCKQIGAQTYQFDYSNMSYCEFGCIDGECINRTFCLDKCIENETMCNKNYVILCEQKSTGCWGWTNEDQTFCKFGCTLGICLNCTNLCNPGDAICKTSTIKYCDDDNSDGCLEYSEKNVTFCEFGCIENVNVTTQYRNVTCNYHSFDDIYIVRDAFVSVGVAVDSIFDTLNLRVWITMILMIGAGGFAGVKLKNAKAGLVIMATVLFGSSWVGWMPWVVTVIFLLFVGGVWFYGREK